MFKLTDLFPKPTAGQAPEAAPGKEEPKIELPPLFESPEPCEFPSRGEFTPDLDFGRYWRLNYSLLSAEERKAYEDMETAIRRGFSSVQVELPPDNARLMNIAKSLIEDNWSLFYVDTSITVVTEPGRVDVCFRYNRFREEREKHLERMKEVARNVFETRVKGCSTAYDAEMAIHDWIIENVKYDSSDPELAHSPLGPLLYGKGVCEGISEAFCFLACSCGLKAAMASGKLRSGNHRWNVIELDGERYHLDVTSDLSGLHAYFNCSDKTIGRSHTGFKRFGCNSDRLNYYVLNGARFVNACDATAFIRDNSAAGAMFEFMVENGVMPQEVTRIVRTGAGGHVTVTTTHVDHRYYRVIVR